MNNLNDQIIKLEAEKKEAFGNLMFATRDTYQSLAMQQYAKRHDYLCSQLGKLYHERTEQRRNGH